MSGAVLLAGSAERVAKPFPGQTVGAVEEIGADCGVLGRLPERPTSALPGTREKVEVMFFRRVRGESLHHPQDARLCDTGRVELAGGDVAAEVHRAWTLERYKELRARLWSVAAGD